MRWSRSDVWSRELSILLSGESSCAARTDARVSTVETDVKDLLSIKKARRFNPWRNRDQIRITPF